MRFLYVNNSPDLLLFNFLILLASAVTPLKVNTATRVIALLFSIELVHERCSQTSWVLFCTFDWADLRQSMFTLAVVDCDFCAT